MIADHEENEDILNWTILPCVPLFGVGTSMVESVEHYAARLAWLSGTMPRSICQLPEPFEEVGAKRPGGINRYCGPSTDGFQRRIQNLEALSGSKTARYGSFAVVDGLISRTGFTTRNRRHRWCPECFLHWDCQTSWEPLAWSIDILTTCPVHGCDLEVQCRACGKDQTISAMYAKRRSCRHCKNSLGGIGKRIQRPRYFLWANEQVLDLVELCATPGQAQISYESYEIFLNGLKETAKKREGAPAVLMAALSRTRRKSSRGLVTLRNIVHLCALQGVSITQVMRAPASAASRPLLDLWHDYEALEYTPNYKSEKMRILRICLTEIMKRCANNYLPSMAALLKAVKINRDMARELLPEIYEPYQYKYRCQADGIQRAESERAFKVAFSLARVEGKLTAEHSSEISKRIAATANVSYQVADRVRESAWISFDALQKAKVASLELPNFVDPEWLKLPSTNSDDAS